MFFCLFRCFAEKEYQTESKRNKTFGVVIFEETEYQTESKRNETFGSMIFGANMIQETWTGRQEAVEAATRVAGVLSKGGRRAQGVGAPPASWLPR